MIIMLKIAWRNLWRNPRRTLVLVITIAVAIFGYLGTTAFIKGFKHQMLASTLDLNGGHIRIAAQGFQDNPVLRSNIRRPQAVYGALDTMPGLVYAPQVIFTGMINSSETAAGVIITGIDAAREKQVSIIDDILVRGSYLSSGAENTILLGEALAQRLDVRIGEKVVLMANDLNNDISSDVFRLTGVFRSTSTEYDKSMVFIPIDRARRFVGFDENISAVSIRLEQDRDLEPTTEAIRAALGEEKLEVLTWKERFPILMILLQSFDAFTYIFIAIVFTAIAFSIINTFLMVIYERIIEFGIMMAIGVLPGRIRRMLLLETVFVTLAGSVAGVALTAIGLGYWMHHGLDLSIIAEGLGKFGIGALVYPVLETGDLIFGLTSIFIIVLLSVLYPAFKAGRFKPVDAINFV